MLIYGRKREAKIRGVIESTVAMYGDLQGIAGKALQEIDGLELPLIEAKVEVVESRDWSGAERVAILVSQIAGIGFTVQPIKGSAPPRMWLSTGLLGAFAWRRSTVSRDAKKKPSFKLPDVRPGSWRGEILGGCTVNFGQVVQVGPPRQSVEFTYVIMPAALTMPEVRFTWPGVIMIMTPTPMKTEFPDAGHLFKAEHLPSLHLSLQVTRGQFSDMLRMLEAKRLKDLHFTVEDGANGSWPVFSWGMSAALA